jgi:hypothetical protein
VDHDQKVDHGQKVDHLKGLGVLEDFSQIRSGLSIERCSLIATEMENSAETN